MIAATSRRSGPAGPLHALLLAFPVALFPAALVADIAYLNTAVIQWTNFAQWLNAGADFFTGLVLAWTLLASAVGRKSASVVYTGTLAALLVLGVINAFQHGKDGWASVGTLGLVLSVLCTLLALAAGFVAYSGLGTQEARA